MHLLSAFILAISCSIDNLAVAIALGTKRIRISLLSNLSIALISAIATYIALLVGQNIRDSLPAYAANVIGSIIIIAIGVWIIWDTLEIEKIKHQKKPLPPKASSDTNSSKGIVQASSHHSLYDLYADFSYESFLMQPEKLDKDRSGYIEIEESIALAFGLSLNNLGSGIGGGISGFDVSTTTFLSLMFSILAVTGGYILGKHYRVKISALLTGMISGFLIIGLGIYEHFVT